MARSNVALGSTMEARPRTSTLQAWPEAWSRSSVSKATRRPLTESASEPAPIRMRTWRSCTAKLTGTTMGAPSPPTARRPIFLCCAGNGEEPVTFGSGQDLGSPLVNPHGPPVAAGGAPCQVDHHSVPPAALTARSMPGSEEEIPDGGRSRSSTSMTKSR